MSPNKPNNILSTIDRCPFCNAKARRHSRRALKQQYHCLKCDKYFTYKSEHKRSNNSILYRDFFNAYIQKWKKSNTDKNLKIDIVGLCGKYEVSKSTIYRNIKPFNRLVEIVLWFQASGLLKSKNLRWKKCRFDFHEDVKSQKWLEIEVMNYCKVSFDLKISLSNTFEFSDTYNYLINKTEKEMLLRFPIETSDDVIMSYFYQFRKLNA